ncbi:UDP-glucuronosyl/UDP-glucosyltransferase [Diaporthe helianthi]|uniref:UDP-glucuronosyl/UDP-glucosyltransferase n=1 Tax=Diaporthe helianthi TaxID=158607 RepID=A0A2P5HZA3_DIAHE|nr:UDP-glucuronosyl/UDP-glucosyltransferase [Diaporthe helianthi]
MFRNHVKRAGVKYISALRSWNFEGLEDLYTILVGDRGLSRHERWASLYTKLYKKTWVCNIPSSLESVRRAMGVIRQANPNIQDKDLVIMAKTWALGLIPLRLGAKLPEGYAKAPKILGPLNAGLSASLGLPHDRSAAQPENANPSSSLSSSPFGLGEAIRARNALLARLACAAMGLVWDSLRFVLRMCGARDDIYEILAAEDHIMPQLLSNISFLGTDTTLQMCVPGLEYDNVTWPRYVRFGGTLPPWPLDPGFELPGWFRKRLGDTTKTVVFATQGTIAVDYMQVIVPTIKALAGRDGFTVVATLGRRGASLDSFFPKGLPANAIVLDYFLYTPILERANFVVTNGSYGIYSQCATFSMLMLSTTVRNIWV